jgi:predicted DsbA family dithiol-disulfide isomerase
MRVTVFTDPGCPFGFNAQRQDLQLMWHYGDALGVERRMIVLTEETSSYAERGFDLEMVRRGQTHLAEQYGMPMVLEVSDSSPATIDGCRAYVGARLHAPEHAARLLRALRRRAFSRGERLDDRATIAGAAADAGLEPDTVLGWLDDAGVEAALREDMAAARDPLPEALALPHKLSGRDKLRYSTASAVYENDGRRVVAPGFQPFAVHEVAVASVAPALERRPAPASAREVLDWAPYPLATAEVAELRGIDREAARRELEQAGATFTPEGTDGYWG